MNGKRWKNKTERRKEMKKKKLNLLKPIALHYRLPYPPGFYEVMI